MMDGARRLTGAASEVTPTTGEQRVWSCRSCGERRRAAQAAQRVRNGLTSEEWPDAIDPVFETGDDYLRHVRKVHQ